MFTGYKRGCAKHKKIIAVYGHQINKTWITLKFRFEVDLTKSQKKVRCLAFHFFSQDLYA